MCFKGIGNKNVVFFGGKSLSVDNYADKTLTYPQYFNTVVKMIVRENVLCSNITVGKTKGKLVVRTHDIVVDRNQVSSRPACVVIFKYTHRHIAEFI